MQIEIQVDGGKYPVAVNIIVLNDGQLLFKSELLGSPVSTFAYHQKYQGSTLEQSVGLLAKELRRALAELMEH